MGDFVCANQECRKEFKSKHSIAKYCSRKCSIFSVGLRNVLDFTPERIFSDAQLLEKLIEVAQKIGRTPTSSYIHSLKIRGFSPWLLAQRFGSYTRAIMLAGLIPNVNYGPEPLHRGVRPGLRFKILKRDNFRCVYCGGSPSDGFVLQVDHIIPIHSGGKTEESNLATACSLCNLGKSNLAL